jgi:hypothetical protein
VQRVRSCATGNPILKPVAQCLPTERYLNRWGDMDTEFIDQTSTEKHYDEHKEGPLCDPRLISAATVLIEWLLSTLSEPVKHETRQAVHDVA